MTTLMGISSSQAYKFSHRSKQLFSYKCFSSSLESPSIVFSNHHLLAVNKPAGWHSVPNTPKTKGKSLPSISTSSKKCLLSYLKSQNLGGGSDNQFLLPLHRLDQPCTGLLLFAKNSKAASRITKEWKLKRVQKTYLCAIEKRHLEALQQNSSKSSVSNEWFQLTGRMLKRRQTYNYNSFNKGHNSTTGWSVSMIPHTSSSPSPVTATTTAAEDGSRICQITFQQIPHTAPDVAILEVHTSQGARHMVRSLLAQIGHAPILGDLRYGGREPLPDRSIALHARGITFGSTLKLAGLEDTKSFAAPVPTLWKRWIKNNDNEFLKGR